MNDLMCGHIQRRRVRCGKTNCRCAKGEMHIAFYHVWHSDGRRHQKYVRRAEVEKVRNSCLNYRQLQKKLRIGRLEYKQMLARFRRILEIR